jgi:hypothetical protein
MLQKSIIKILVLVISPCFTSCEGYNYADGIVLNNNHLPEDSVLCKVVETSETVLTDQFGHYMLEGPFGSCMRKCEDMTVEYSKIGFQTKTIKNPGNENVYLSK